MKKMKDGSMMLRRENAEQNLLIERDEELVSLTVRGRGYDTAMLDLSRKEVADLIDGLSQMLATHADES